MNKVQDILPTPPPATDHESFLLWILGFVVVGIFLIAGGGIWWLLRERKNGRPATPVKDIETKTKEEVDDISTKVDRMYEVVMKTDDQNRGAN